MWVKAEHNSWKTPLKNVIKLFIRHLKMWKLQKIEKAVDKLPTYPHCCSCVIHIF